MHTRSVTTVHSDDTNVMHSTVNPHVMQNRFFRGTHIFGNLFLNDRCQRQDNFLQCLDGDWILVLSECMIVRIYHDSERRIATFDERDVRMLSILSVIRSFTNLEVVVDHRAT